MNKFILSVVFFVSLSSLLQAQNEQVQLADSLIKRSQQFSQSLQYDSSLYYQKKALPIYLENELMYKYYLTQTQIAYSLAKAQQIQPALDLLGEVEVKVKEDTSLNLLAEVKRNEAIVYETVGNFEKAIALYKEAFEAFRDKKTKDSQDELATLHLGIGVSYAMSGSLLEADKQWNQVVHIYDSIGTKGYPYYAVLTNLATLSVNMDNMERSLDYYDQALKAFLTIENNLNSPQLILLYYNMANAYTTLEQYNRAMDYAMRAKNILEGVNPNHPQLLPIYSTVSEIYGALASFDDMKQYVFASLDLSRKLYGENHFWTAQAYGNIGNYYADIRDGKKAIENHKKARAIIESGVEIQDYDFIPKLLLNLGMNQVMYDEVEEGAATLEQGFQVFRQFGLAKSTKMANAYLLVSAAYKDIGMSEKALEFLQNGLIAISPAFNENDLSLNPEIEGALNQKMLLYTLFNKALMFEMEHAETGEIVLLEYIVDIANLVRGLVNEVSLQSSTYSDSFDWQSKKAAFNDACVSAGVRLYEATQDEEYLDFLFKSIDLDKSNLMVSNIAQNQTLKEVGLSDSLQDKRALYAKNMAYLESRIFEESQKGEQMDSAKMGFYENELFAERLKKDELNEYLQNNFPSYFEYGFEPGQLSLTETQQLHLSEGEVQLNYWLNQKFLVLLSITADDAQLRYRAVDSTFHNMVREFTEVCQQQRAKAGQLFSASKKLRTALWLDEVIGNANQLTIIPDGELSLVPFEAIAMNDEAPSGFSDVDFLVESHSVAYANSVTSLNIQLGRDQNLNDKVLAFVPSFGQSTSAGSSDAIRADLTDLTWTKTEVENLSNYFSTESYFDSDATEQAFKEKASDYKIVHIATHGLMDDQAPLFSKLVFSPESQDSLNDGFINTRELFAMDIPAQLVVLSACETGSGVEASGEGIVSLANGFFFAGSKSVVMTLWQANDQSSAEVMDKFYEKLADGMGKAEALRQSKIDYLQQADGLRANPYYWAHFVINGDPRPLQSEASTAYLWFILLVPLAFVFIRNAQNKKRQEV